MKRILLVRMSALGDIVHALPVLAALRDQFPSAEIDWLVEAAYAGILDLVEGLDRRIVIRPGYLAALRSMRARKYDVALDLQGLIKSAAAARLSGARRVVGFEASALRERGAAWFYSETVNVTPGSHVVHKNLATLRALGLDNAAIRFPFAVPRSAVAEQLQREAPEGYALINPGGGWPNKRWDPARFGLIAARLRDRHGLATYVLWGPQEAELADQVVAASSGAARRSPPTTLGDLLAAARGARLMISGDTGPAHLAAAVGTPIVGLYGPTWPARNGPWDPADEVVSRADTCQCHHKRRCLVGRMCINEIAVDEVSAAVERRLAKGRA